MRVTVAGTLVVVNGRPISRQDHPKTSNSFRTLEVPEFTANAIRELLAEIADEPEDHLLFVTRNGTPLSMNSARRTLRKMLADAKITDFEVTPHSFRRTGGTVIARATDSKTAAEVLGNSEQSRRSTTSSPSSRYLIACRRSTCRHLRLEERRGAIQSVARARTGLGQD